MNKGRLLTIFLAAIVAIGFFAWLTNSYVLQSQADIDTVDVLINPKEGDVPRTPISFIIQPQDNTQQLSAADLTVNVENGTLTGWDDCSSLGETASSSLFTELINETGNTARYSCAALKQDSELPQHIIMSGKITCDGSEPVRVTVDTNNSQVTGLASNGTEFGLGEVETAEFSCSGQGDPTVTEDIVTEFTPETCSADVGEDCGYTLDVRSADNSSRISGYYIKLEYDEDILELSSTEPQSAVLGVSNNFLAQADDTNTGVTITQPPTKSPQPTPTLPRTRTTPTISPTTVVTTAPTDGITATPTPPPDPTFAPTDGPTPVPAEPTGCSTITQSGDGMIEILYTCSTAASKLPTALSQNITFTGEQSGSGSLRVAAIQVVGPEAQGMYTASRGQATYDIGGGASDGNVTLDMSLRMQCVVSQPAGAQEMDVRIGLGDGPLNKAVYKTGTFRVDENGHWNGTVSFNVPPGQGYKILPKGEKHMQKKVCENNATEDYPGAYGCDEGEITLNEGVNRIDLTDIVLLTGDLPPGEQDGISNAKDQSLVRNLIGKRDAESAELADVNYDGVVNAVDHSCMIAALSVRWDEE